MWYDWLKRTQVVCQARCSSRQFVNSGGTPGKTFAPARAFRSSSTGLSTARNSSSRLRPLTSECTPTHRVDATPERSASHRPGDVEEMVSHRRFRPVGVSGEDGRHDRRMLLD